MSTEIPLNLSERLASLREKVKSHGPIQYTTLSEFCTLQMIFGLYIRNHRPMYKNHLEELKIVLDSWYVRNDNIEFKGLALPSTGPRFKSHCVTGLRYDIQQIASYLQLPEHYIEYIFHEVIKNELICIEQLNFN